MTQAKRSYGLYVLLCIGQSYGGVESLEQPQELPIVVIIPSYNNAFYYKENLDSVFKQKYSNFRVIYINDASTDDTGILVEAYVRSSGMEHKVSIIHNAYNRKALMNIYQAVHTCADNELVILLDGDDILAHEYVLTKFNRVHADGKVWLSYAQYVNWPPVAALHNNIAIVGYAAQTPQDIIDAKNYRWCYKWFWSGLRCFNAWFFKCIKLESLFLDAHPYKGKLLPIMYDAAIMWPMMEMGGIHTKFIPDILLTRNITPLNDFHTSSSEIKKAVRRLLRSQKVYPTINGRDDAMTCHGRTEHTGVVVLVIAHGHTALQETLSSMQELGTCCVVCVSETNTAACRAVIQRFPTVTFLSTHEETLLSEQMATYLQAREETHLLVIDDNFLKHSQGFTLTPDMLHHCIDQLERTYAYALYCDITHDDFAAYHNQPYAERPCELLNDGIGAWQFKCFTPEKWKNNRVFPTLYRIADVVKIVKNMRVRTASQFLKQWQQLPVPPEKVGLFYCLR